MNTIISELKNIDKSFPTLPLVTIGYNKIPLGIDWQNRPLTPKGLAESLESGSLMLLANEGDKKNPIIVEKNLFYKVKGFGIHTGYPFQQNGENYKILAIDCDGQPAINLLNRMTGNYQLPKTVSWTSGRQGRYQLGYLIPERFWHRVKTIKFNTGEKEIDKHGKEKPVLLEFRWEGLQSVFPPSEHPDTGCYKWINSPFETEFKEFPEWGYKMLEIQETTEIKDFHAQNQVSNLLWDDRKWAESYLESINLSNHDWFDYRNILFALHSIGYSESEALSFSRTSSKHTDQGFHQVWDHIKDDKSRNVGIGTLGWLAKQNGWTSPFKGKSNNGNSYNSPLQKKNEKQLQKEREEQYKFVYAEVEKLVKSNLNRSQITIELKRIADNSSFSLNEIKQLFREIDEEIENKDKRETANTDFQHYNERKKFEINLNKVYPMALSKIFYAQADKIRTDPVRFAHYFWGAAGCLWGSKVEIRVEDDLKGRSEWSEWPVFFTADIDNPSGGKTTTFNKVFKFHQELQDQENLRHKQAKDLLPDVEANWDHLPADQKEAFKDTEINPRIYKKVTLLKKRWIFDSPTIEGALKSLSQQDQTKGAIWIKDELSGLFRSLDQYKSDKGDARQQILSAWNGKLRGDYERADESRSFFLSGQTISMHGGIQLKLLNKYFDLKEDEDGLVSRVLFLNPREHPEFDSYNRCKVDIQSCLQSYYQKVNELECDRYEDGQPIRMIARFTDDAADYFFEQVNRYRRLIKKHKIDNMPYAAYIGKMISYIARMSFIIQSTYWAFEDKDLLKIDLQSMKAATEFADFYLNQFLILQGITDNSNDGKLDALLRDIWELCKSLGKYQTRDIIRKFAGRRVNGQKMNAKLALECLQQLSDMGYGHLEGKTLYYQIAEKTQQVEVKETKLELVEETKVELIAVEEEQQEMVEIEESVVEAPQQLQKEPSIGDNIIILGEKIILPSGFDDIVRIPDRSLGKLKDFSRCVSGKILCVVEAIVNNIPIELRLFREEISSIL